MGAVDTSVVCLRNAKKLKRCTVCLCGRGQVNMSTRAVSKRAQQCSFCCVVTASSPPIRFAGEGESQRRKVRLTAWLLSQEMIWLLQAKESEEQVLLREIGSLWSNRARGGEEHLRLQACQAGEEVFKLKLLEEGNVNLTSLMSMSAMDAQIQERD